MYSEQRELLQEASHPFQHGPRTGRPGAWAWAGLYQHNQDYMRYLRDNLPAYRRYTFPVLLVQGTQDIAMPPSRFDGSTGMAFKAVRPPFWRRASASQQIVLPRPFSADGRGVGDGYVPWAGLIPDCTRPLYVEEFFPNATHVELKFVDAGHFVPLEAAATFNALNHFCHTSTWPCGAPRPMICGSRHTTFLARAIGFGGFLELAMTGNA